MAAPFPQRFLAALASGLVLAAMVVMLVFGLAPLAERGRREAMLTSFTVLPIEPSRPVRPRISRATPRQVQRGGGSSATRMPALPSAPVAPPAVAPVVVLIPIAAAPAGSEQGGGTGGAGAGAGSGGGTGSGIGRDSGIGPAVHARQTHGHLSPGDVPNGVLAPGESAGVKVRYVVGADGRVSDCTVLQSSGRPQIDAVPCPLIVRRFRFHPARDGAGQPIAEPIVETHTWIEPPRARPPMDGQPMAGDRRGPVNRRAGP